MSKPSLFSRHSLRPSRTPLTAGEIRRRIEEASASLPSLEHQYSEKALAAEAGADGADADLATATAALRAARERLAPLQAALGAMERQEREAAENQRRQLWESRAAAFRKKLDMSTEATASLTAHIAGAVSDYRRLVALRKEAGAAYPNGAPPISGLLNADELFNAVADEIARNWPDPKLGEARRFPGCSRVNDPYDPKTIPAIADQIEQADAYILSRMRRPWE